MRLSILYYNATGGRADLLQKSEARRLAARPRVVRLGGRPDDPVERLVCILPHRRRILAHHDAPACVWHATSHTCASRCTGPNATRHVECNSQLAVQCIATDGPSGPAKRTIHGACRVARLAGRAKHSAAVRSRQRRIGVGARWRIGGCAQGNGLGTEAAVERSLVHDNRIFDVVARVRHHGHDRILCATIPCAKQNPGECTTACAYMYSCIQLRTS